MSETDPGTDAAGREYFTAIETEFIRRRGSPFLLSPKDFELIRRWRELGIPAADVFRGIAEAFDRRAERGAQTRINSVSYCEGAVLEAWERNASARVGKPPAGGEPSDVASALDRMCEELERAADEGSAAREAIAGAVRRLRKLAGEGRSPEEIEASLGRLEKKLLREAAAALPPETLAAIEKEEQGRLAGDRTAMEPRAFDRTRDVLIRRRLRVELGIPRLSLLG
ncbi:MAG: hypothetical protein ACRD16_01200 [Thermoanaerobaculia bacterium]